MTIEKQIVEDYGMVLKEAQSMGCNKINALYNIPLVIEAILRQFLYVPKCLYILSFQKKLFACCQCLAIQ